MVEQPEIKGPFDFVEAAGFSKRDLMPTEAGERQYNPFLTNRAFSYHRGSIFHANEMNRLSGLDNRLQFDFYRFALRAEKRFGKWGKKIEDPDTAAVMKHYKVNRAKAEAILRILTPEQVDLVKRDEERGGEE